MLSVIMVMEGPVGYQFVHLETYSRKPDKQGRSVAFVLAEVRREPAACQHVMEPQQPVVIHGLNTAEVEILHDRLVAEATTIDKTGKARRLRVDQHTLCTVVASHPATMEAIRADANTAAAVEDWERRAIAWLVGQYGDRLVSVIAHHDELHFHLHAHLLATDDPTLRSKTLHPGWAAKDSAVREAKAEGADGKTANARGDAAYKQAMRKWQDSYWESVGLPSGLARLGPGRRRLTRAEWQIEKAATQNAATTIQRAERAKRAVQDAESDMRVRVAIADNREAKADAAAERARAAIADAKQRLAEAKQAADEADALRRRTEVEARRRIRAALGPAKSEAVRIIAEAEARAAPLRRFGGWLGSVWSGFRAVENGLAVTANARIMEAKAAAAAEIARAKTALRNEARKEVSAELADLRNSAKNAEHDRQKAERQLAKVKADSPRLAEEARQAKAMLAAEQAARLTAEAQRERFRTLWADADNKLIEMGHRRELAPK